VKLARILNRLRTRVAAFSHDLFMIPVAWLGAFWLRFNLASVPDEYLREALWAVPLVISIQGAVNWYFGLYRGVWRFASLPDLLRIMKSIFVGVCLIALALFLTTRMQFIPRSVFPMYSVLLVLLLGGPRLLYRWFKDRNIYSLQSRKALIIGAGSAGEMLVRDLLRDHSFGYRPVGFVDDELNKKGREIHGVRVLGNLRKLPRLVERLDVDLVLVAIPSATSAQMRRIVGFCEKAGVAVRTLPSYKDLPAGKASLQALRDISIEDLLGREPVSLNWREIRQGVQGQCVLVTGGGGSIGAELCRQLAQLAPSQLVIFDQSEFNLYEIERELREHYPAMVLKIVLGDVCDTAALRRVFAQTSPTMVFHAAAFKHVPMLEGQVRQAVRNNVFGTRNTARCAVESGCEKFLLISTDKAVNPTNVMGASKRLGEVYCQNLDPRSSETRFITVRFGNVLDSAGSVVPLFREQIARGGPVTVTHPEVKRYFMTIPEACQLILQAGAAGSGGEVFVLDMGEPVSINYLVRQMILLSGKIPDEDIQIKYVGLRPGEKLFEELFHESEALRQSNHDKLLLAKHREVDWNAFSQELEQLEQACEAFDEAAVGEILTRLVPEFRPGPTRGDDKVIPIESARR